MEFSVLLLYSCSTSIWVWFKRKSGKTEMVKERNLYIYLPLCNSRGKHFSSMGNCVLERRDTEKEACAIIYSIVTCTTQISSLHNYVFQSLFRISLLLSFLCVWIGKSWKIMKSSVYTEKNSNILTHFLYQ